MAVLLRHSAMRYITQSAILNAGKPLRGPSAVSGGHDGGYKLWKNLTLFVALPAIGLSMTSCYLDHTKGHHERPEFVPYDHLRIRNKRFPWGDGTKSLFHNPHVNALPGGYED